MASGFNPTSRGAGCSTTSCTSGLAFSGPESERWARFQISHPFARKMAKGWGTQRSPRTIKCWRRRRNAATPGVRPCGRRLHVIDRYTRPAMGRIWTEDNKYRCWLQVESAASEVLAEDGVIPTAADETIANYAGVSAARIQEIEAEVKHDVIAFTTAVAESLNAQGLGAESRWLHYGLTSNDVVDTAQALQVKEASGLIRAGLVALLEVLKRRAIEFKHTPTIGRTHGIHAEPTTFGLKLLNWYAEMERNVARFDAAAEDMRVGKLSGAVGTFGHLKPA